MAAEHTPSISRGLELVDSQHFDAIVLDYRADQSSDQFFARLRQSAKNRASLLIAVVDGNFNARPVFGLGANFVLYRPLSSERTRIRLRAARNLMRRERRRAPRARCQLDRQRRLSRSARTERLFDRPQRRRNFDPHLQPPSARLQSLFRVRTSRSAATGSLVGRGCVAARQRPHRNSFPRCAPVFAPPHSDLASAEQCPTDNWTAGPAAGDRCHPLRPRRPSLAPCARKRPSPKIPRSSLMAPTAGRAAFSNAGNRRGGATF